MATDEQLIQQIQQGESEAFGQLFSKYQKQIHSIVFRIVKNPHDAEEVVQDTFVRAYLKLDQLKKPDKFSAWLKRIAQNCSKNYLNRKQEESVPLVVATAQISTQTTPDRLLLKQELIDAVMEVIESLPQEDREMIRARIDGLSHSEISEQFGISISTSTTRLYRIRKKIKARVKDLLNAIIGLPKMLSLEKIISGGILAMKIGTSTKVTVGVIGVLVTGFIGFQIVTHQPDVESSGVVEAPKSITTKKVVRGDRTVAKKKFLSSEFSQQHSDESLEESGEKTESIQPEVAFEIPDVLETEDSETTISPESDEVFLERFLRITESPQFKREFEEATGGHFDNLWEAMEKEKKLKKQVSILQGKLADASVAEQNQILAEPEATQAQLEIQNAKVTELAARFQKAGDQVYLKYFTEEETSRGINLKVKTGLLRNPIFHN